MANCIRDARRLSAARHDRRSVYSDADRRPPTVTMSDDDALRLWLDDRERDGYISFVEMRDGIAVYQILKPLPEQVDDE